jgi:acyl-coenzyme A synthetase/AMP-(fatty) acid ligase/pimeloyl-ACP methyl ester carboxylesterase
VNVLDLPGVDPDWSRRVRVTDSAAGDGTAYDWHVLDNGPVLAARGEEVVGTVLCVHGNPTWSYLWRRVLAQAPPGWRVVAVDQLGMGWSERTPRPRTLRQRVTDLGDLTAALELTGPVVTLAHDWGGPISLGWALAHRDRLAAVVLTNTAVHQPEAQPRPAAIRLARSTPLLDLVCRRTPAFVRATTATCLPPLPKPVRDAFASPYASAGRRRAVADFVADIPFETGHPSHPALSAVADGVRDLDVPALLVWGTSDPVFSQRYLEDLADRLPHADIQVYPRASHLVLEDHPEGVEVVWSWITSHVGGPTPPEVLPEAARVPVAVDTRDPDAPAIVELGGRAGRISRAGLAARVESVAAALHGRGVRPGDRVAVLVPPGIDLTTVVYAVWRLGAVVVVADAGLGLRRLGAALRGAGPDHVLGIRRALALVRATRVPGTRTSAEPADVEALAAEGTRGEPAPPVTEDPQADGAVLFTSGATGPPKGVVYTRGQLGAQVALLRDTFDLQPGERFVAAFAPFALYGPALGLSSAVPDMDVTAPHTLTAAALAEAVEAVDATVVFASPAALRNVVATASELTAAQRQVLGRPRLVLSAGAPVPTALLEQVRDILTSAGTHTPYGMTEALPVATIDPTTVTTTGAGVCVGHPVPGVQVRVAPLAADGTPSEELVDTPGVLGEVVVRGPHVKQRYDRRWAAQQASARPAGWHRTGDVGQLDGEGRLWVGGRWVHVITTADGPLAPYAVEHRVAVLPGVADVAVVGVGPQGAQQVVAVVVPETRLTRRASALADPGLAAAVRERAGVPVAAVLLRDWLPVDIRHASKVDRTALARWAEDRLHPTGAVDRVRRAVLRVGGAPSTRSR